MGGSGLEDLIGEIFAPNVTYHILSGKAYARALRGHILIHSALVKLIFTDMISSDLISEDVLIQLATFNTTANIDTIDTVVKQVEDAMEKWIANHSEFRTAMFWHHYIDYIDIVKCYVRAERTGDWLLHLSCVDQMLNLFAATGRIHYTHSARLYLQNMTDLPQTHPEIFQQFVDKGHHVIRRSDRYWAGLWSDLAIEQVMMRSIKCSGGLTRGRGFQESTRNQWISTAHQFASVHDAMTRLTHAEQASSDQHKDMTEARIKRDEEDFEKIYTWLKDHNPFDKSDKKLKSLSSGVVFEKELSCESPEEVGRSIQKQLDDMSVSDAKVKKRDMISCMDSESNKIQVDKKAVEINPTLLFTRLTALASREDNVSKYFESELTPYPMALFKDGNIRKTDKASLRNMLLIKESSGSNTFKKF